MRKRTLQLRGNKSARRSLWDTGRLIRRFYIITPLRQLPAGGFMLALGMASAIDNCRASIRLLEGRRWKEADPAEPPG
jgi:hypothetical protein